MHSVLLYVLFRTILTPCACFHFGTSLTSPCEGEIDRNVCKIVASASGLSLHLLVLCFVRRLFLLKRTPPEVLPTGLAQGFVCQDSCACTRFLCMHNTLVHAQHSCACTGGARAAGPKKRRPRAGPPALFLGPGLGPWPWIIMIMIMTMMTMIVIRLAGCWQHKESRA